MFSFVYCNCNFITVASCNLFKETRFPIPASTDRQRPDITPATNQHNSSNDMSEAMIDEQQAQYERAQTTTARGGQQQPLANQSYSRQTMNTAMQGAAGRLQPRPTEIQSFSDVRPALLKWLNNQDALFKTLEQTTGLQREMIFYGACGLLGIYMILGPAAGLLCNLIGFAYPAYQSVIAIRTEQKDDDTQWLVYWTTFGTFSVIDFFAESIYHIMPLYWLVKLSFLLYLAMPQTLGAHNLYVKYVDPAFDKLNESVLRPLGIGGGGD